MALSTKVLVQRLLAKVISKPGVDIFMRKNILKFLYDYGRELKSSNIYDGSELNTAYFNGVEDTIINSNASFAGMFTFTAPPISVIKQFPVDNEIAGLNSILVDDAETTLFQAGRVLGVKWNITFNPSDASSSDSFTIRVYTNSTTFQNVSSFNIEPGSSPNIVNYNTTDLLSPDELFINSSFNQSLDISFSGDTQKYYDIRLIPISVTSPSVTYNIVATYYFV
jgi:hypothetical protein